jgi:hypothetical protein
VVNTLASSQDWAELACGGHSRIRTYNFHRVGAKKKAG